MSAANVVHGDMLDLLPLWAADGFTCDVIITDPPYHLASIAKRFGSPTAAPAQHGKDGAAARLSRGFMGSATDAGDISFRPETWRACLDVLKPGGRMAVFGGTRTFWRTAVAIDAVGFEIEDTIMWVYGQGLVLRQSRMKPAYEPILLCRKAGPVQNLNIEECRVPAEDGDIGRWPSNLIHDGSPTLAATARQKATRSTAPCGIARGEPSQDRQYSDSGATDFAAKPGARRLDSGSAARFFTCCPFSEEEKRLLYHAKAPPAERVLRCTICSVPILHGEKAEHQHDRALPDGRPDWSHLSAHPTVKPLSLMEHLVRLLCPPDGLVLDPFGGTGSTTVAAVRAGRNAICIERDAAHAEGARKRLDAVALLR